MYLPAVTGTAATICPASRRPAISLLSSDRNLHLVYPWVVSQAEVPRRRPSGLPGFPSGPARGFIRRYTRCPAAPCASSMVSIRLSRTIWVACSMVTVMPSASLGLTVAGQFGLEFHHGNSFPVDTQLPGGSGVGVGVGLGVGVAAETQRTARKADRPGRMTRTRATMKYRRVGNHWAGLYQLKKAGRPAAARHLDDGWI